MNNDIVKRLETATTLAAAAKEGLTRIPTMDAQALLLMLKEQESVIDSLMSDMDETLDVVTNQKNVVRCGDCAKRKKDECMIYWNGVMDDEMWNDNWFCADGVKKDD